jgi:hypothetical protein
MSDDAARVEKLLAALLEVTQRAEALAIEVTKSLRADRRAGRSATPGSASAADATKARRSKRDRRKAQDER